ncbi:MAG: hypothetical protein IJD48_00830 [Clostridia bacterium]|nr:hypothetical protein [Clostridia bacterium]
MGIGYNKLPESAKEILAVKHNVPEATTIADGPFFEEKPTSFENISVFETNEGKIAVGDPAAYLALQQLMHNKDQVQSETPAEPFGAFNVCPAPEMGC